VKKALTSKPNGEEEDRNAVTLPKIGGRWDEKEEKKTMTRKSTGVAFKAPRSTSRKGGKRDGSLKPTKN